MASKSPILALLATAAIAAVAGPAAAGSPHGEHDRDPAFSPRFKASPALLAKVRRATVKYQDVDRAIADGYLVNKHCFAPKGKGAMGMHYGHPKLALDRKVDITKPEVLLYAPKKSGGVRLVGVEYFVADADQNVKTRDTDLPRPLGRELDGPMLGHEPGMPVHNDLHLWLYESNPRGMFAPYNSKKLCG